MNIEKIFNNNVVVALNDKGQEIVVMGRGLGFQKRSGDLIEQDKIEKVFTLSNKDMSDKFQQLVAEIPMEFMVISEQIINYAKVKLGKKLNDSIYISLTDHIHSAVERHRNGIELKNALLWDTKRLYKDEFAVGKEALKMIRDKFDIELPEDEAAFIALHIVNAQLNEEMPIVMNITKVMQEILNIVKYHFKIEFDEESLSYYRFTTHLKFFAQRLFNKKYYDENKDNELFDMVKNKYSNSYQCTKKIQKFIEEKYTYELTKEEMLYLTIHIERVVNK